MLPAPLEMQEAQNRAQPWPGQASQVPPQLPSAPPSATEASLGWETGNGPGLGAASEPSVHK